MTNWEKSKYLLRGLLQTVKVTMMDKMGSWRGRHVQDCLIDYHHAQNGAWIVSSFYAHLWL